MRTCMETSYMCKMNSLNITLLLLFRYFILHVICKVTFYGPAGHACLERYMNVYTPIILHVICKVTFLWFCWCILLDEI
jgi:hypothetical protein